MSRCSLVTGGAGFIGSHIAQALLACGDRVRIFDNLSTGRVSNLDALHGEVEVVRADLRDVEAVRAAMEDVDVVFHQAAIASVPESLANPVTTLEANVVGTQHILLAARDHGVRRVVFASSCALYGERPELPSHEALLPNPLSPYAVHKLTGEGLCGVFTRTFGLETVALRYFNVFGPRQDPASDYAAAIPKLTRALARGASPVVFGDGEQTRDFIYVGNVAQANLLAAEAPAALGQVINIGSGESISINGMLRVAAELLGVSLHPEYREARAGDVRHSRADISRAKALLGYEPSVGFRDGLALTIESLVAQG
ncbi:MAG TPA: NAD-dependent epimerase/dehydratase family protein [Ktedonobacterales bacterium]|jgi:nucleoside-diphosphate-sugar epimerase